MELSVSRYMSTPCISDSRNGSIAIDSKGRTSFSGVKAIGGTSTNGTSSLISPYPTLLKEQAHQDQYHMH